MRIERLNQNLNFDNKVKIKDAKPDFTGMSAIQREISSSLYHSKVIGQMKELEWLKGEMGGILLTALGTGAVAPIFIGFNPFVHAKKDATPEEKREVRHKKEYTAMRQPISALLAILFQASVQKYIDRGWDSIINNPEKAKFFRTNLDQSELNTDTFIERKVKAEMKAEGIKKPTVIEGWFSKEKKAQRAQYKEILNQRTDAVKDSQVKALAKYFEANDKIKVGTRFLDNQTLAGLVNDQIDSYIKDAEKLKKSHADISRYVERAEVLMNNEEYIKDLFGKTPASAITREFIDAETNPQVKVLLEEILSLPEDLRANRMSRTLNRIDVIKDLCKEKGGYSPDNYRAVLLERNNILDDRIVKLLDIKIKDPAKADEASIKQVIENITSRLEFPTEDGAVKSVLKDTDTFGSNFKELKSKVYKDIVKTYKKLIKNHYKSLNQVSKIAVGVCITLPITCTALNWIYPRFMEIFFPKLANSQSKKDEQKEIAGGDK